MMKYVLAFVLLLFVAPAFAQVSEAPTDLPSMTRLAQQGDSNAQLNLGNYYATPHNAPPDFETAVIWYRKAADQGNAEAQYRLGDLYYRGKGVGPQSFQEAYFWYSLAAKAGSPVFAQDRDETAHHLTDEQVEAVNKRVDDWTPKSNN